MKFQAEWITTNRNVRDICPVFLRRWSNKKTVQQAILYITALGVYEANLNGSRVGDYILAPGWTAYKKRIQYQMYSVSEFIQDNNELSITVGKGWFSSPMPGWEESEDKAERMAKPMGLLAELHITYIDGTSEIILTDHEWSWTESRIRFSEIYDGEFYDNTVLATEPSPVMELDWPKELLIPQEGEQIKEQEIFQAQKIFRTPNGDLVVDFGQEVTGYVEFTLDAAAGDEVILNHGEVLDADGNFYNANYRSAKAEIKYICKNGRQTYHPHLTFFGFRYIRLVRFPGEATLDQFRAICVYSDIRKTGELKCSDNKLNQLFSNIFWGQRDNFLDVPTDCPQRDERLGWTGDAQVFVKAASYNFDVKRFFKKWLRDLAADQRENGAIGQVIPDYMPHCEPSAAWGDAATICPWQIYLTYGDSQILQEQFESMKKWVDYITEVTKEPFLWRGGIHFGDWLGLDAPVGSYKGASREDFIASAYYSYSTALVVKTGLVLGEDVARYQELSNRIRERFQKEFSEYFTQTECVLAVFFELTEEPQRTADQLAAMIQSAGNQIQTGFVGTPYILHVLSRYGYTELAYTLLLREEYPSWLYSVNKGATTIWEHWDGIMKDGTFWSTDMNSFNHYAYGAVADWVYEEAAGIHNQEAYPGFARIRIEPKPDARIEWLEASIETVHGKITSRWEREKYGFIYFIETPVEALVVIAGLETEVKPGTYRFTSKTNFKKEHL